MLSGTEAMHDSEDPVATVLEFWQWACSNLWDDGVRGDFAEFVVARCLGLPPKIPVAGVIETWESHDFETGSGIKVEVKSSASQQAWPTTGPRNIQFSIKKTKPMKEGYGPETGRVLHADVYVFCELKGDSQRFEQSDLVHWQFFDLAEWKFYVVPKRWIEQRMGQQTQTSLTLSALKSASFGPLPWKQLKDAVQQVARRRA